MIIEVTSPTRVDLAGGTLDMWPIYCMIENSVTVNLSIDVFSKCEITSSESAAIVVDVADLDYKKEFTNLAELVGCNDPEVSLIKELANYFSPNIGFTIRTSSQSPVGGGLGGSSSLMISMINAFEKLTGKTLETLDKVMVAKDIEAKVLQKPTGLQDYIPAALPGLNIIEFKHGKPKITTKTVNTEYFSQRCFLVDTGKAHHSGINNWQVFKAFIDGDAKTAEALHKIKDVAQQMRQVCLQEDWEKLPELFNQEFQARMLLSEAFSSPEIETLEKLVLQSGGEAVKICGAGGGGSVLVWTQPETKDKVMQACQEKGFQVIKIIPA